MYMYNMYLSFATSPCFRVLMALPFFFSAVLNLFTRMGYGFILPDI